MDEKEISKKLREEETRSLLISSLPSDINWLGYKLFKYQECWYFSNNLQGVLNFQRDFKAQDTDIILASFPKAGTTWLKALTFALFQRSKHLSDHPLLSHNPHELVPFLEFEFHKSSTPDLTKFSSSSSSPRLLSTHMPLHTLQEGLKKSPCKIVYLCRNLKDVLVSHWFFANSIKGVERGSKSENINQGEDYTFEALFESFCSGVSFCGPFWENVLSYWRGSLENPMHVLFMSYEELKAEPHAQIKRLAEFLDCPFTKEEEESGCVDEILQLCSFSNLKALEINKTGKSWNGVGNNSLFRRGEVGDWKSYLTPEMEKKIDMIIEEKLRGSGLKF